MFAKQTRYRDAEPHDFKLRDHSWEREYVVKLGHTDVSTLDFELLRLEFRLNDIKMCTF
jgi:hypothetical protein